MKNMGLVTLAAALLGWSNGQATAEGIDAVHFEDAVWVQQSADGLARCGGTYRGAAHVMRAGGREQSATYLDAVSTGALFAAYILLTSSDSLEDNVLDSHDATVYIERLARGSEGSFKTLANGSLSDGAMAVALRSCVQKSSLQSSVLETLMPSAPTVGAKSIDATHD